LKINPNNLNPAHLNELDKGNPLERAETGRTNQRAKTKRNDPASTELSEKGREMANIRKFAQDAPELRMKKIEELRNRIKNGDYSPEAKAVADRLVDDHLRTAGVLK